VVLHLLSAFFTVNQVGALIDLFTFGGDKVDSVAILKGRIVDRSNAFQLFDRFTFDSDKEKVKRLLATQ
jgi:hypothetical protein